MTIMARDWERRQEFREERALLEQYLSTHHLKLTKQRALILGVFLSLGAHVTAEELYTEVSKADRSIGLATIYRTLNLLCAAGLASQKAFGDGQQRYERRYKHEQHDHVICHACGKIVEFETPHVERIKENVAAETGFIVSSHRLVLYGLCRTCQ